MCHVIIVVKLGYHCFQLNFVKLNLDKTTFPKRNLKFKYSKKRINIYLTNFSTYFQHLEGREVLVDLEDLADLVVLVEQVDRGDLEDQMDLEDQEVKMDQVPQEAQVDQGVLVDQAGLVVQTDQQNLVGLASRVAH